MLQVGETLITQIYVYQIFDSFLSLTDKVRGGGGGGGGGGLGGGYIPDHQGLGNTVIFLPARPASQTHDSHKGRMILNHVNPAGSIKNCGEKSAFKNLQLSF